MSTTQIRGGIENASPNFVIGMYFLVKILPMLISGVSIYLGYKLFVLGVTGEASLSLDTKTVSGQLLNAAPGLFFGVGGIVALITSIFKGVTIDFKGNGGMSTTLRYEIPQQIHRGK